MKKKVIIIVICFLMLFGNSGNIIKANAKVPYTTPWGKFYRNPEVENNYGRSWFTLGNNGTAAEIYLESYYNYGCGVTIKIEGKNPFQEQSNGCSCKLKQNFTSVPGVIFKGNAYRFSFSKYAKR